MVDFGYFIRRYLAPGLGVLSGRKRYKLYSNIRNNEWMGRTEINTIQLFEIRKLMLHVRENVPYYKEFLGKKHVPQDEDLISLLNTLPISTKKNIQSRYNLIHSGMSKNKKTFEGFTGGSTGNPLKILYDSLFFEIKDAAFMRSMSWGGWMLGKPIAMLWGGLQELSSKHSILTGLKKSLTGYHMLGSYKYDNSLIDEWIKYLKNNGIEFIYGYASVLNKMALYQKKSGIKLPKISAIFTTAETLFPDYRKNIEDAFQCKVYDQYGSREVVNIAAECEKGNMHILSDMVYPEFLPDKNSSMHRLVLTSFSNYAMPFIRYDIGDYASPQNGDCPCGRGFPLMEIKIGRSNDHLKKPNGQVLYPSYFIHLLDGVNGISSFQFRQKSLDSLILILKRGDEFDAGSQEIIHSLEKKIRSELDWKIKFDVQEVDEIPIPPSGKHRYVISDI